MQLTWAYNLLNRIAGKAKASPSGTFAAMSDQSTIWSRWGRPTDYDELYKAVVNEPTAHLTVFMPANDIAQVTQRVYRRRGTGSGLADQLGIKARKQLVKRWERYGSRSVKARVGQIGEDIEEVTDPSHPLVSLLTSPNPRQTGYDYTRNLVANLRTAGGVFEVPIVSGGIPVQLETLSAKYVRAELDESYGTLIREWVAHRNGRDTEHYGIDEIIVYGSQHLDEPGRFVSPLAACLGEVKLLWAMTEARTAMMNNGGHPGGMIESTQSLNEPQRRLLEAEFQKRMAGPQNAGMPMILTPGLVYKETARGKELDWNASVEALQDTVLRTMGVPNELLDTKDANLAGAQEASPEYARRTLLPIARMMEDHRNERLVPMFGEECEDCFIAFDDMVGEDREAETRVAVSLVTAGMMTPNEWRESDGREPKEGGDELLLPQPAADPFAAFLGPRNPPAIADRPEPGLEDEDEIVVTDVTEAKPEEAPIAEQALNGAQVQALREMALDVANGQLPASAAIELMRAAFPSVPAARIETIINEMAGFVPRQQVADGEAPPPPVEPKSKTKTITDIDVLCGGVELPGCTCADCRPPRKSKENDVDQTALFRERAAEVSRLTETWYRETYTDAVEQAASGAISELSAAAFVQAAADRFLEDVSAPLIDMFKDGYEAEGTDPNLGAFAVTSDRAAEMYRQHRIGLSRTIASTALEDAQRSVDAIIEQGFDEGLRRDEISTLLSEKVPGLSRSRAETIARTEVANAQLMGRLEAWEDSEFVEGKLYLLSSDPCPICEFVARKWGGDTVPLRTPFLKAGDAVPLPGGSQFVATRDALTPPCHPRCRCSMAPKRTQLEDE